ncbi:FecR domain-containing protein [Azohydromonas caseinilytica]|uniref:FecR domain-containing protein n=1 Tax=Azohydromonas caseinilytica TaxID=2728836 RepID=A0A848F4S7_9BURK|nr:FecR domain-containing protein [Azohydromonas caseinilytica]NML13626.1 FecR domain-containing protein [Azohydromonas caseinilytica]
MLRSLVLFAAMAAPLAAGAAEAMGGITILEGEALVYRGAGRLLGAEGLALAPGDIVQTAPATFVQLEFADRSVAQLGPATRAMLNPPAERGKAERALYLLQGWAKVKQAEREPGKPAGLELRTPWAEIPAAASALVLHATPAALTVFVESGEPRLNERGAGAATAPVALKEGQLYQRKAGARGELESLSQSALLQDMPRPFRDSLPLRAERWREQNVAARPAPDFGYADVEPWLKAEPALRKPLVQRWKAKARDGAFRAALVQNLSAHPEWDPVLFPEKYLPKRAPTVAGASSR